jgi:CBS domain-containing protein
MKVQDVMSTAVVTVTPTATLREAARTLVEHGITGMPVVNADGGVVGVLSEADIVAKEARSERREGVLARLFDPGDPWLDSRQSARTVAEAMSAPAITIASGQTVAEAASVITSEGVNRLPVVDQGKLVGIVTRADLVRAFVRTDEEISREITKDVVERVFWLDPSRVQVSVSNGAVTLAGSVETDADVKLLPELVRRVPGVVNVSSTLQSGSVAAGAR